MILLSIGFIFFPKYMRYYRTDEFFIPVKESQEKREGPSLLVL